MGYRVAVVWSENIASNANAIALTEKEALDDVKECLNLGVKSITITRED